MTMNVFDPDYSLMATDFPMEIDGVVYTAEWPSGNEREEEEDTELQK